MNPLPIIRLLGRVIPLVAVLSLSVRASTLVVDSLSVTNAATVERSLRVLGPAPAYTNFTTNSVIGGAFTNSLVGYWPFDSNMNDYSGFNNNGTNYGSTQVVGRIGGAYRFNGVNNYAKLPYSTNFVFTGDFTISFWASNVAQGAVSSSILGVGYGYANGWIFTASASDLRRMVFALSQSSVLRRLTSDTAMDNNWHNTAVVRTGSVLTMFIDGIPQSGTTNYSGTIDLGNYYMYVGGYQAEGTFNAVAIDELALWRRALSVDELKVVANVPPVNTNLLLQAQGTNVEVFGTMKIQSLAPQGDIEMGSFTNRP
jgi:hypothetical protein